MDFEECRFSEVTATDGFSLSTTAGCIQRLLLLGLRGPGLLSIISFKGATSERFRAPTGRPRLGFCAMSRFDGSENKSCIGKTD